jgi:hypothetical protein
MALVMLDGANLAFQQTFFFVAIAGTSSWTTPPLSIVIFIKVTLNITRSDKD